MGFLSRGVSVQNGVSVQGSLCPESFLSGGGSLSGGLCLGGLCQGDAQYGNMWWYASYWNVLWLNILQICFTQLCWIVYVLRFNGKRAFIFTLSFSLIRWIQQNAFTKQECIPVGCLPSTAVAVSRGCTWSGGVPGPGGVPGSKGVYLVLGGVPGSGGCT